MARILVVDDHPVNRQFLVKLLGYVNHTVMEAADGSLALAMVQADRPDLVITDIVMPNMDGPTFVKEMRQKAGLANMPVIFYTASYRVPDARNLAQECGVSQIMHKPAKPEDVLDAVNVALHLPDYSPQTRSILLDAEMLRLAALTELGLDLVSETSPTKLLQKFLPAVRFILNSTGAGAIVTDLKVPNGCYAALTHKSADLPGPPDPRAAAEALGKLVNWQPMARLTKPTLDAKVLGLAEPIRSLLLAAISLPERTLGTAWLYVTDKIGDGEFTREDERMTVALATQLAVTFENARLHAEASCRTEELQEEIVERKIAEDQLRVQTTALKSAANGVVIADSQGNALWINPAFTRMTGFTEADVIGQNMRFLKSGKHDRAFYQDLWKTIKSGQVWAGEMINRRKDGSLYTEEQTITPVLDEQGAITRFIAVKQDVTERKRVEYERDRIFEQSLNLLCIGGFDGFFKRLNPAWESTLGFSREELLAEPFLTFVHPEDHAGVAAELQNLAAGRATLSVTLRLRCKDGSSKAILWNATPFLDQESFYATGQDITERKQLEDQYRTAQERLQHVVTSSPAVLFTVAVDREPHIPVWVSDNIRHMLGYDPNETLNADWWPTHVHPDDREDVSGRIRQQLSNVGHAIVEYRIRHKNATYRWIRSEKRLLHGADGKPTEIIGSWSDVTDRKLAEENELAAQKRLQAVVASSPSVLFTLAIEDNEIRGISWMSDNVFGMLGYKVTETLGADWWVGHVHPDEVQSVIDRTHEDLFSKGITRYEYRFRHQDNSYRWLRGEIRLLRDAGGKPIEAVGSWSDITDRKLLEEQYRQAQKMEAIGKLAGGVAHDFNNLLTIILGYSDMYLGKLRPEDPLCLPLSEIRKAGERATGLTRQLLAFSRKQVLAPVVFDLNETIADMDKMLHRLIGEDVALTAHAGSDLWKVKADPGQMEQVVMNIIVNARDAMPQGGKLLMETENVELDESYTQAHAETRPGEYVLLAISDTGCGMNASVKARIFEPFFTTKGPTKGTGLGLATVFGIVKQSGGHIAVYSEVGQGTTFKIYLPRDKSGAPIATSKVAKEAPRGGTETILLVEDEDGVRTLAMTVLKEHGYTVLEARHGGDALIICETRSQPIDLMITDVVMPHFSGRQLAERLATRQPTMKVLFMSGYTDDAIVHHGVLESGMSFLQKPFTPEALARRVRGILETTR